MRALSFSLFGIPIRVQWSFFLITFFFAAARSDLRLIAEWLVVAFVSVIAHELGHATAGRAFGLHSAIELPGGGGFAAGVTLFDGASHARLSATKRVLISLAGPGLGLVVGAICVVVRARVEMPSRLAEIAMDDLVWINVGWGLVNLIPALPLDGGNVLATIVDANVRDKERGARAVRIVSALAMGIAAVYELSRGQYFIAIMAGYIAFQNLAATRAR